MFRAGGRTFPALSCVLDQKIGPQMNHYPPSPRQDASLTSSLDNRKSLVLLRLAVSDGLLDSSLCTYSREGSEDVIKNLFERGSHHLWQCMPISLSQQPGRIHLDRQHRWSQRRAYCCWSHLNPKKLARRAIFCNLLVGGSAVIAGQGSGARHATRRVLEGTIAITAVYV